MGDENRIAALLNLTGQPPARQRNLFDERQLRHLYTLRVDEEPIKPIAQEYSGHLFHTSPTYRQLNLNDNYL
jgi:hypothetical protein